MCKDVDIETELMQLHVENGSHEDVELQSELRQALEVLIDEHENVGQPNVKSITAYVEVGESTLVVASHGYILGAHMSERTLLNTVM